jgi:hypothetical protein
MGWAGKLAVLTACACSAPAQAIISAHAGLIDQTYGEVRLNGERVRIARGGLRQMKSGDILSTGEGRAEALLAPEIALRLGSRSSARLEDARLEDTRLTLEQGSAIIEVVKRQKNGRLRVRAGAATVEFKRDGLYRFDIGPGLLRVYGGQAEVTREGDRVVAKRGQAVNLQDILALAEFTRIADELHSWAAQRSFALYSATSDTRRSQSHWEITSDGWIENDNYKVKYPTRRGPVRFGRQIGLAIPGVPSPADPPRRPEQQPDP